MNEPYTPRLNAFARMQSRPLGTNTALYRDPSTEEVGRDYRRQQSDYGLARRLLRRDARAGDANAAIKMIGLQDKATADGVSYGGIQSGEARQAAIAGRIGERQRGIEFNDLARKKAMAEMGGAPVGGAPAVGGAPDLAAPLAAAPESYEEMNARKVRESTLSGAFGTGARDRLKAKEAQSPAAQNTWSPRTSRFADSMTSRLTGLSGTPSIAPIGSGRRIISPSEEPDAGELQDNTSTAFNKRLGYSKNWYDRPRA